MVVRNPKKVFKYYEYLLIYITMEGQTENETTLRKLVRSYIYSLASLVKVNEISFIWCQYYFYYNPRR